MVIDISTERWDFQVSLISLLRKLHKWFAVIVAVQLSIWVVSGLVFSFINHKEVDGKFIFENQLKSSLSQSAEFTQALALFPDAKSVSLIRVDQKSVFKLIIDDKIKLIDAETFEELLITERLVKSIANTSYNGGGELTKVNKVSSRNDENREMPLPVWQLVYNDEYNTKLYFSAATGEFQGVRTDSWRVFDFFMMLHFMDFFERGNFNNGLIIFFASVLVLFSVSGMLLINSSFSFADFTQLAHRFVDKKNVKLTVKNQQGQQLKLTVTKDATLLDVLFDQRVAISSDCGGGGICGTCRVKVLNLNEKEQDDLTNHKVLTDEELSLGYRLACQLALQQELKVELDESVALVKWHEP